MPFTSGLPMRPGEVKTYPAQAKKKGPYKPQQRLPRTFAEVCQDNGSADQARESARVARQRQGERED